jgi:bifunctional non-homologous end joining protein LigD
LREKGIKKPIRPMLATLVPQPFNRPGWTNEEKYDGFRALAYRRGKQVRIYSRNLKDKTADFPGIVRALAGLSGGDFILDGEIVVFDRKGISRFQLLQRRELNPRVRPVFAVFDCLESEGEAILDKPLTERRKALQRIVPARGPFLMRSRLLSTNGLRAYREAQGKGWEGIISKDGSSPYQPGRRTRTWLKVKSRLESEFVIGGYTPPEGQRTHFGALLVGLFDGRRLRYTGKVGTGYSGGVLAKLAAQMKPLKTSKSPFEPPTRERGAAWVHPRLVAQIAFAEWTKEGKLRQPVFLGLRDDKNPSECQWRERERQRTGGRTQKRIR